MSPLDPDVPPVGEEIHLPGPTILPLLTAVGITLTLVGVTTFIEFTVVGVLLTVGCAVRWSKTRAAKSTSSRSTEFRLDRAAPSLMWAAPRAGGAPRTVPAPRATSPSLSPLWGPSYPTAALAGTGHIAPSSVQQRTTSRTERIPIVSPCSTTIRWRKPPRTIAAAASSKDQDGSAKTTSRVR